MRLGVDNNQPSVDVMSRLRVNNARPVTIGVARRDREGPEGRRALRARHDAPRGPSAGASVRGPVGAGSRQRRRFVGTNVAQTASSGQRGREVPPSTHRLHSLQGH